MTLDIVVEKLKKYWQLVCIFVAVLIVILVFFMKRDNNKAQDTPISSADFVSTKDKTLDKSAKAVAKEADKAQMITVDVKGAVKYPAIYTLAKESRVADVIKLAGGVLAQADTRTLNLARKLTDEMVIYVVSIDEVIPDNLDIETTRHTPSETQIGSDKININSADVTELQKLSGVGLKKAQDIVNYREQNGNFKNIEDLVNVSGIGEKSIEKLKESITVD